MKRIRYVLQPDGSLLSMQIIPTKVGEVKSLIFPDGMSGQLIDAGSGKAMSEMLRATSSHKIKIKLKAQLTALGVAFDNETRSVDEANESSVS